MMIDTCALYGNASYANSWLTINLLVILIGFLIVASVYAISGIFASSLKSKLREMVKTEIVQLTISIVIIAVLIASAATACNISASVSQSLIGTSLNPITFAETYIGNLSLNSGINLLSYLYTTAITYGIDARIVYVIGNSFTFFSGHFDLPMISPTFAIDLSIPYNFLATLYMTIFSPLLIIVIGMLLLQFILLPFIQYTAFTVILPVSIAVRSVAYVGGSAGLRNASNALLSIAIALYLIYPLTIGLDAAIMHWIFSAQNPTFAYLQQTIVYNSIPPTFLSTVASTTTGPALFGLSTTSISSLLSSAQSIGLLQSLSPFNIPKQATYIITSMAQFIFVSVFLFALNVGITMAFAMSLTNALDAGIDGIGSFWRGL